MGVEVISHEGRKSIIEWVGRAAQEARPGPKYQNEIALRIAGRKVGGAASLHPVGATTPHLQGTMVECAAQDDQTMKLLFDFFPVLLFFAAYKVWGIYAATGVAIAAAVSQVAFNWLRYRKVETIHLVTLGLIVVLGGATLLLHDSRFIMWKPTLVNWAFAIAFFASHFIGQRTLVERMMGGQITLPIAVWHRLSYSWIAFFIALGCANLYVAFYFAPEMAAAEREALWVNFKLFGMMGLTFLFVIAQAFYLSRHMSGDETSEEK
jgi:intracellular septation protein